MDIEEIRHYCLEKQGTSEYFPFDESTLAFRVLDKIFLMIDLDNPDWLVMKCDPDRALELRDTYPNIVGAWHMNKRYWNQVLRCEDIPTNLMRQLIDHSYDEVVRKFSRPKRALVGR